MLPKLEYLRYFTPFNEFTQHISYTLFISIYYYASYIDRYRPPLLCENIVKGKYINECIKKNEK